MRRGGQGVTSTQSPIFCPQPEARRTEAWRPRGSAAQTSVTQFGTCGCTGSPGVFPQPPPHPGRAASPVPHSQGRGPVSPAGPFLAHGPQDSGFGLLPLPYSNDPESSPQTPKPLGASPSLHTHTHRACRGMPVSKERQSPGMFLGPTSTSSKGQCLCSVTRNFLKRKEKNVPVPTSDLFYVLGSSLLLFQLNLTNMEHETGPGMSW